MGRYVAGDRAARSRGDDRTTNGVLVHHRLKTNLSTGAALVAGFGMLGLASATPAQAEVAGSLNYTCSEKGQNIDFKDPWKVDLALDIPDKVEQGETIPAGAVTAKVTPGADATATMQGLNVKTLKGTGKTTYTLGESGEARDITLEVPQTDVPATGEVSVTATGKSTEETAPNEDVNLPITAGNFTADLENQDGFIFKIECTAPTDATVGNVAVGAAEPPAEEPGGGTEEPGDDTGSTDDPSAPTEDPSAPAEDPSAPADEGTDDAGSGDAGAGDSGDPEVPGVVQTDGVQDSSTAPLALGGGLLLAGAGAGLVISTRRKASQH